MLHASYCPWLSIFQTNEPSTHPSARKGQENVSPNIKFNGDNLCTNQETLHSTLESKFASGSTAAIETSSSVYNFSKSHSNQSDSNCVFNNGIGTNITPSNINTANSNFNNFHASPSLSTFSRPNWTHDNSNNLYQSKFSSTSSGSNVMRHPQSESSFDSAGDQFSVNAQLKQNVSVPPRNAFIAPPSRGRGSYPWQKNRSEQRNDGDFKTASHQLVSNMQNYFLYSFIQLNVIP